MLLMFDIGSQKEKEDGALFSDESKAPIEPSNQKNEKKQIQSNNMQHKVLMFRGGGIYSSPTSSTDKKSPDVKKENTSNKAKMFEDMKEDKKYLCFSLLKKKKRRKLHNLRI